MEYQDIITFEPKKVDVIFDTQIVEFLSDPHHQPLMNVLRKGNFTVNELVEEYAKEGGEKKSDKTIYRYLKKFEEKGIIAMVGNRLVPGKKATQAIYGRTAKLFYFYNVDKGYWSDENRKKDSEVLLVYLAKLLSLKLDIPPPDTDCLRKLMIKHDEYLPLEMKDFLDENIEKVSKIIDETSVPDLFRIVDILRIFSLVLDPSSLKEELNECFPTKVKKRE